MSKRKFWNKGKFSYKGTVIIFTSDFLIATLGVKRQWNVFNVYGKYSFEPKVLYPTKLLSNVKMYYKYF